MLNLNEPQPVEEIIGIGPVFGQELDSMGFKHDIDLLAFPEAALVHDIAQIDGLSASMIQSSVLPQARLLRLPGSNGTIANLFLEAGFRKYSDFLGVRISKIKSIISKVNVDDSDDQQTIFASELLLTAVQLAVTGGIRVVVVDGVTREVILGAKVSFSGDRRKDALVLKTRQTDERGAVDFEGIAPVTTALQVSASGYRPQTVLVVVEVQRHAVFTALMSTEARQKMNHDEFTGGLATGFGLLPSVNVRTELSSLPSRPPIYVETVSNDEAVVGSLWFRQEAHRVVIPRLVIPVADLPNGTQEKDVLVPETSSWRLHPDGLTASEFRQALMKERSSNLRERQL